MSKKIIILGIESSCDDTSAAIISDGYILSNIIANQKVHEKYGGVVPELASREHQKNIIPVVDAAIKEAGIKKENISAISFTKGPGLLGSLLVGSSFSKSFALGMDIPLIAVNHMKGHIMAHFIKNNGVENTQPVFPFLCLTVSGGHTQIVLVKSVKDMIVIGETLDDALGETFDKVAKLIGLSYPGGPEIEKKAKNGSARTFNLPNPLEKQRNLNFSFSGMKTAINLIVKKHNFADQKFQENLSASFQEKVVSILESKLALTIKHLNNRKINISQICLVGGVASNKYICEKIKRVAHNYKCSVVLPRKDMLSDNAAMIAWACLQKYLKDPISNLHFKASSRLKILNDSK